jgi:hypothetical protein
MSFVQASVISSSVIPISLPSWETLSPRIRTEHAREKTGDIIVRISTVALATEVNDNPTFSTSMIRNMTVKVFWPDDLDIGVKGELYGWRLADDWIVVAGVLSEVRLCRLLQIDGT